MGRRLYVGNLPYSTTDEELNGLFSRAGTVESVRVMRDMATGRARGFAFVQMASDEDAQRAITEFHQFQLEGERSSSTRHVRSQSSAPAPEEAVMVAAAVASSKAVGITAVVAAVGIAGANPAGSGHARVAARSPHLPQGQADEDRRACARRRSSFIVPRLFLDDPPVAQTNDPVAIRRRSSPSASPARSSCPSRSTS